MQSDTPWATIFDMDGVLVDSEPLWQAAEIEVFGDLGLVLEPADTVRTRGLRIDEVVSEWLSRFPRPQTSVPEVVSAVVNGVIDRICAAGRPMDGALEAVSAASSVSRIALASSSPMRIIEAVLEKLALRHRFEVISSGDDEPYGKPHPGIYLSTARRLGIPPTRCVAIEDSFHGILSAKAARMICIAVPEPAHRSDKRLGIADAVLMSLDELSVSLLQELRAR